MATAIPGQEFVNALGGMVGQAGQHVGKPSLRIERVEFGGRDQGVDRGGATAAFVGAGEGPVFTAHGNGTEPASAALFDRQIRPSSRKRVKACQRVRM